MFPRIIWWIKVTCIPWINILYFVIRLSGVIHSRRSVETKVYWKLNIKSHTRHIKKTYTLQYTHIHNISKCTLGWYYFFVLHSKRALVINDILQHLKKRLTTAYLITILGQIKLNKTKQIKNQIISILTIRHLFRCFVTYTINKYFHTNKIQLFLSN